MKKTVFFTLALSFGLAHANQTSEPAPPLVAGIYQHGITAAWNKTSDGELPVYECLGIVTTASKMVEKNQDQDSQAQQAYKACYVEIMPNYANAYFAQHHNAEPGENNQPRGCAMFSMYIKGHVASLEAYAEKFKLQPAVLNQQILDNLPEPAASCGNVFM